MYLFSAGPCCMIYRAISSSFATPSGSRDSPQVQQVGAVGGWKLVYTRAFAIQDLGKVM